MREQVFVNAKDTFQASDEQLRSARSDRGADPVVADARALDLSVETVKDHVAAVLRGLNVNTRTQAVLAVAQMLQPRLPVATRAVAQSAAERAW